MGRLGTGVGGTRGVQLREKRPLHHIQLPMRYLK